MNTAPARAIALTGSDQLIRTGGAIYRGFTIRETAGAAATIRIHDGTSASGTLLDVVGLAIGESAREWYDTGGIWAENGVYVDIVTGTIEGSIRIG